MERFEEGIQVTWLSVGLNLFVGIIKVGVGLWGQSRALVADGLHSLTDLATDAAVIFGFKYARLPSDETHLYGHHKIATLVSGGIGLAILGFCALILHTSIRSLGEGRSVTPSVVTLVVALGSLAVKEWLFHRTRRIARKINSSMLLTNAWHHRTDSSSSVVAAIGIAGAIIVGDRLAFLDPLAAVLLGGYLALAGGKLCKRAMDDLMDAAPERAIIDDLREHILPTPGVRAYHAFRARRTGDWIEVDLHLLVDPKMTVEESHRIASRVKKNIIETHPEVISVLVHVEPFVPNLDTKKGIADRKNLTP